MCFHFQVATHTEYKTLEPVWHRVFEMQVFNSIQKVRRTLLQRNDNDWQMSHLKRQLATYFQVKDVHGILYLTVYDEDKNHKSEFLGKIAVPLLKMVVRIQIQKLDKKAFET